MSDKRGFPLSSAREEALATSPPDNAVKIEPKTSPEDCAAAMACAVSLDTTPLSQEDTASTRRDSSMPPAFLSSPYRLTSKENEFGITCCVALLKGQIDDDFEYSSSALNSSLFPDAILLGSVNMGASSSVSATALVLCLWWVCRSGSEVEDSFPSDSFENAGDISGLDWTNT